MTILLTICVGSYLLLASREFKNDKKSLVFDYNQSLVTNVASDIESFMTSHGDKMRLLALFYREPKAKRDQLIADLMREKRDLVFVTGSDRSRKNNQVIYQDLEYMKTYGLTEAFWQTELMALRPVPYDRIEQEGYAIWNSSVPSGPPVIGFAKAVVEEDTAGIPINQFTVVGYVRVDRLLKSLEQGRPNEVYMSSQNGEILVHPNAQVMQSAKSESEGLFRIASEHLKKGGISKSVAEYSENGERILAAYAYAFHNQILVMSKISERKAFGAVNRLVFRSLLFASMVMTLAFLVTILFSRSLTSPIDTLMQGMSRVAAGDLNSQITVNTSDEIALLAGSFNRMTKDLKASREELENINRELEDKVRARTKELEMQNRAVKEAQEALLRTTRLAAVGEVAGQAAHEVLNPLTTIMSRLNKLKERITSDRAKEVQTLLDIKNEWSKDYQVGGFKKLIESWQQPSQIHQGQQLWDEDLGNLEHIGFAVTNEYKNLVQDTDFLLQESERIQRIISSFRSLNTQKGDYQLRSVNELCYKSIQVMADLAEKDQIKVSSDLSAKADTVLLDQDEFMQVMTNILRNAFQSVVAAKRDGQVSGRVQVQTRENNGKIEVHIVDDGKGIVAENQSRLFEKNFTTKSRIEGTGIGLSISRRLIRSYHGDIYLQSSSHKQGAHFVIELPLNSKKQDSDQEGAA